MKPKRLIFLEKLLRVMAKVVLARHKPKIVAITGSVGKTSTKAAVFTVLSSKFDVRENQKNYNNEIGIPLTIIGAESGGKNIFKWIWIFVKWIFVIIFPAYPEILVLELGVDRPGDMKHFMSFVKPMVGVVTNVSISHIEYFGSVENIVKEKRVLIESLAPNGFALLNCDDEKTIKMKERTSAEVITFGKSENAIINASNIVYNYSGASPMGISFKLNYDGKNIPIRLRNILAEHQVYSALAAVAVGTVFKINLVDIAKALEPLRSPAGRMNLLEGIRNSFIIDDTYNASPVSTVAALDVLGKLAAARKIAVLGDMLELGNLTDSGHCDVGQKIFETKIDLFVAVGSRMEKAVEKLLELGFSSKNIFQFENPEQASQQIGKMIKPGDFILVKGSQGMRMEKIVESILNDPDSAKNLLCRQSPEWKSKLFLKP